MTYNITPKLFNAAAAVEVGADSDRITLRSIVPPSEPLIPLSANIPRAVFISTTPPLKVLAVPPTVNIASPSCETLVFDFCAVTASRSAKVDMFWVHQPKPTAAMGKYGSMRLKFIWQTPHLIEAIMLNEELEVEEQNLNRHCEEMNEKALNLIEEIVEKKKQSEEYKTIEESGKFLPKVQILERYRAEAEEEILPVTVYAI